MKASLPRYLEEELGSKEVASLSGGVETLIYHSGKRASSEDARIVSEEMAARGFVEPKLTNAEGPRSHNGRDRNE